MIKCIWEQQNMTKAMYEECIKPLCAEFGLATIELDILLFLANNPECCTATDIVNIRKMTKSHVSAALKTLSEHGYVEKEYKKGNRKTIYLKLTDESQEIVARGREAQNQFTTILFDGFSEDEIHTMQKQQMRIGENVKQYFRSKNAEKKA